MGFTYEFCLFTLTPTEHHIGLDRKLSGYNHNISVCRILENLKAVHYYKTLQSSINNPIDRASFTEFLNTFRSGNILMVAALLTYKFILQYLLISLLAQAWQDNRYWRLSLVVSLLSDNILDKNLKLCYDYILFITRPPEDFLLFKIHCEPSKCGTS